MGLIFSLKERGGFQEGKQLEFECLRLILRLKERGGKQFVLFRKETCLCLRVAMVDPKASNPKQPQHWRKMMKNIWWWLMSTVVGKVLFEKLLNRGTAKAIITKAWGEPSGL